MELKELYDIADENNIDIDFFPLRQAISIATPNAIALDVDKLRSSSDEKAALGHELGHCMTGSFYTVKTLETRGRMEARANRWAFRKLVPWEELNEAVRCGITEWWDLADYFSLPEWFLKKAVSYYLDDLGRSLE